VLLCNTEYFYVAGSDMYLNNTHRMHYFVSTATVVTRMTTVTLYVHSLSFLLCILRQNLKETLKFSLKSDFPPPPSIYCVWWKNGNWRTCI